MNTSKNSGAESKDQAELDGVHLFLLRQAVQLVESPAATLETRIGALAMLLAVDIPRGRA